MPHCPLLLPGFCPVFGCFVGGASTCLYRFFPVVGRCCLPLPCGFSPHLGVGYRGMLVCFP